MLLHGYNPSDGSFTGTSKFSNPEMELEQKGDSIAVADFTFTQDVDLYKSDGKTFSLIDGWEDIKAARDRAALPPPKYATASEAKLAMTAWINSLTAQIQDEYPDVVQKGWIEEEAMATAFTAGTENAQQLAILTADATSKGRTPSEHAARILEKAQAFRSIALQTRNLWLSVDKALDDATPDQFETILQGAIAQAAPLAAAFGLKT